MINIAFVHHKGGTGKTTSCLNIAGWLAKMGQQVLVVDLDPQGNATTGLGIDRKSIEYSVTNALFGRKKLTNMILETTSGIHLIPSSLDLLGTESLFARKKNAELLLKKRLHGLDGFYDFILIDVPPGSSMLMKNGIAAAGNIIIPVDSGVFAYETMETLETILTDIEEELRIEVNIMYMLLRDYPTAYLFGHPTREIKKMLTRFLAERCDDVPKIHVLPHSREIYRSQMKGMPVSHHSPWSDVGRAYQKIAKEIIKGG